MNSTIKKTYTKDELLHLYNLPLDELLAESSKYMSDKVEFCSLINARNGKCSQNCKYCAQSSHYRTDIESYPLVEIDEVVKSGGTKEVKATIDDKGKSGEYLRYVVDTNEKEIFIYGIEEFYSDKTQREEVQERTDCLYPVPGR